MVKKIATIAMVLGCSACSGAGGGGGGFAANGGGGSGGGGGFAANGGGGSGGSGGGAQQLPSRVNIEMIGALIAPGKADHAQWDLTGMVPDDVWTSFEEALGVPGTSAILGFLGSAAVQALEKPDPIGSAEIDLYGNGFDPSATLTLANESNNTEDTFTPNWPTPFPGWPGVQVHPTLAVRANLIDEDSFNNDNIGAATITYDDIRAAWLAQGTYWVRVEDQTQSQLLALGIQVTSNAP